MTGPTPGSLSLASILLKTHEKTNRLLKSPVISASSERKYIQVSGQPDSH